MSHHVDTARAREDGRLDLGDVYVFEGADGRSTVFIMTVNPLAGEVSPTTFHPEALYEFKIDVNGDHIEELSYRVSFREADAAGRQGLELRRAEGQEAKTGRGGEVLAAGSTTSITSVAGGGRVWAGLVLDPFFGNGNGLEKFLRTLFEQNRFDAQAFDNRENIFHQKKVTAIVLERPQDALGAETIEVWATTALWHDERRFQINRAANPLMQHLFNITEELKEAHNEGVPSDDVERSGPSIAGLASKVVQLAQSSGNPEAYGQQVVRYILPDVLTYKVGTPALYGYAGRNGRRPSDDGMDLVLSVLANRPFSDGVGSEGNYRPEFPYLVQVEQSA